MTPHARGFGVISPHADLIRDVLGDLACHVTRSGDESLYERVVLVDPTNPVRTVTINPLEKVPGIPLEKLVDEFVTVGRRQWKDSWGPRMEDLWRNSLIALGEAELPLGDLPSFLASQEFRARVLEKVANPITRAYFERFESLSNRDKITWSEPVSNKMNAFLADSRIRQMLSHPQSSFNLREVMDSGKVLLISTDKGSLGESSSDLLNGLFLAKIQLAAFSRSDIPESERVPWILYLDEFQNFVSETFSVTLSEAKAHEAELRPEGKTITAATNLQNHEHIGNAIYEADHALNGVLPGWSLSRDSHYQLANRFAWAWKLADMGLPTILIYLGFLNAAEMKDQGHHFIDHSQWLDCMTAHGTGVVPEEAWERSLLIRSTPLVALIRSADILVATRPKGVRLF